MSWKWCTPWSDETLHAWGVSNSVDPDQTPYSGATLFAQAWLSEYLGAVWSGSTLFAGMQK